MLLPLWTWNRWSRPAFGLVVLAMVLAWAFEITPEGIKRESEIAPDKSITRRTGRKIAGATVIVAVLAAVAVMVLPLGAVTVTV